MASADEGKKEEEERKKERKKEEEDEEEEEEEVFARETVKANPFYASHHHQSLSEEKGLREAVATFNRIWSFADRRLRPAYYPNSHPSSFGKSSRLVL